MNRKAVSGIMLTLLLITILTLAVNIQSVRASGTIYIRADGSVEPDTAPISSVDNVTYTFTDNIYDAIVVQRSSIIIDGNGYTLQGTGGGAGFGVGSQNDNVTIRRTKIKGFLAGIWLASCHNTISGNDITQNNECGIGLSEPSYNNTISRNNITNNKYGIWLWRDSPYNSIVGNSIANNEYGICLPHSCSNTISGNSIVNNGCGIELGWMAFDNTISGNSIANNEYSIWLCEISFDNTISGNSIVNNGCGIVLDLCSGSNQISGNIITQNRQYGIWLRGDCSGNTISENSITNHECGIELRWGSFYNSISGNNITQNRQFGIRLFEWCLSNTIYHNNFVDNTNQAHSDDPTTVWDDGYPSGGNYWSDYTDVDLYSGPNQDVIGSDSIWDHPYLIDVGNKDTYPLVKPYVHVEKCIPVAVITAPTEGYVSEEITFGGVSSYDPDGGLIIGWLWDFGDGTISTEQNPLHTYALAGTYEVTLVVTDDEDQVSDLVTHIIRIKSLEEAMQELTETIKSWDLPRGTENSLTSKLQDAIHLLDKKNENGAIHKLMDFINQVEALQGMKLTIEQAEYLAAEAQRIIDLIKG